MQTLKIIPFSFSISSAWFQKREQYIGFDTVELKPNLGGKGFERRSGSLFNFIVSILGVENGRKSV